ncbi:hypothetical protein [Nioella ostreopsis]|uniref:hypothetical protein n=1 Tax=Nioella ostreopsis TaxID=2448479 RepID=UPI000FDC5563|nr:hypothetical protein [Nioella ostreopsis]
MTPRLDPLSTRLFPKGQGAAAYQLEGVAARCDWVLCSDYAEPTTALLMPGRRERPHTIFVSLRSPFRALEVFAEEVLPRLNTPFVLITGSEDVTLPQQLDARWRAYTEAEEAMIERILAHPKLCHWFAENLSCAGHPSVSPLPLGLVFPEGRPEGGVPYSDTPPLSNRAGKVLVAHRVREGLQWETRRRITAVARTAWAEFCTVAEDEVAPEDFERLLREHVFVVCAEGGGLDPSPKAWQALIHGAIPIIKRGPLDAAYARLPVAFVDDWEARFLTPEILSRWQVDLAPQLEGAAARERLRVRLGLDYWWAQIEGAWHPGQDCLPHDAT